MTATGLEEQVRSLQAENATLRDELAALRGERKHPLTAKQRRVLAFVADRITATGSAPSFEAMARALGFKSLASVHEHLTALERRGWIRRDKGKAYAITVLP
ncbi:MAG TPA: helix-turn-helix domain-containing protein [Reyranella sp.]|nr:helix-turn-helix domain-containing protein [Reyranella sp.]